MRRSTFASIASGMALALCLWSGNAMAQASRTWVSGVGDDVNPCSRTAPCKTYAGAISKTAAGGEISTLDPGGFGAVTITKAMTIDGGGGQVASVLVSGTNGINVQAGAADTVILRNLRINGINGSGLNGIRYISGGSLTVENCDIFGFSQAGVSAEANGANIVNTVIEDSAIGLSVKSGASTISAAAFGVKSILNGVGFSADATGGGTPKLTISQSSANQNGTGVQAIGGANAQIIIGSTNITLNGTGVLHSVGSVVSFKNNEIDFNTTNATPALPLNAGSAGGLN